MAKVRITLDADGRQLDRTLDKGAKGYERLGRAAKKAAKDSQGAQRLSLRERGGIVAQNIAVAGGGIGGAAGQVAAGSALGPAGLAIAGASVAMGIFTASINRSIDSVKRETQARQALRNNIEAGQRAAGGAAVGQNETIRQLFGLGGQDLVNQFKELTEQGLKGVAEGLTQLQNAGRLNNQSITAALTAANTGQITFGQAAGRIAGGLALGNDANRNAARLLTGNGQNFNATQVAEMVGRLTSGTGVGGITGEVRRRQGNVTGAAIGSLLNNPEFAARNLSAQENAIRSPQAMALLEASKAMRDQIAALERVNTHIENMDSIFERAWARILFYIENGGTISSVIDRTIHTSGLHP